MPTYYLWHLHALQVRTVKISFTSLHKAFDSRIRLGIMSALAVNEMLDFNSLKEYLDLTDGNLASHIKTLEENSVIKVQKGFIGKKTNTTYSLTKAGEKAFRAHIEALEKMIRQTK